MALTTAILEIAGLIFILCVASKGLKKANWERLLGLDLDREEQRKEREKRAKTQQSNLATATKFAKGA